LRHFFAEKKYKKKKKFKEEIEIENDSIVACIEGRCEIKNWIYRF
jgi:hypothetical protein